MTGEQLATRRAALGLSQTTLARRLGVPAETVNRWERGVLSIRHPRMLGLALDMLARHPEPPLSASRQPQPCLRCGIAAATQPTVLCVGCYEATHPERDAEPSRRLR